MYVFVYGSLLGIEVAAPCVLRDHACGWDVAMDNRATIPGYKYYVDPGAGERPAVYVTFLCHLAGAGRERRRRRVRGRRRRRWPRSTAASATTTAAT